MAAEATTALKNEFVLILCYYRVMSTKESRAGYAELSDQIDQQFPFSKLLQWASELRMVNYKPPIDQEELMQLVRYITFHRMFRENLMREAGLGDRDIFITRPSTGKLVEINHGSFFWPDAFSMLEDPRLNEVVLSIAHDRSESMCIPRSAFSAAIDGAVIAVGSIVIPHHLPLEDVNTIVKWHALRTAAHPLFQNDRETGVCFYGGMKIIANRLHYGVDSVA